MTEQQETILQKALNVYGIQSQTLMLAEECAEVVKAASKLVRNKNFKSSELINCLVEEIADVRIMLNQMRIYYEIPDEQIDQVVAYKIGRLEKNLNSK